jgi:hypothetical protein
MPGTTTRGYPYPTDTDPIDVAGDMQALAEAIDVDNTTAIASPNLTDVQCCWATIPQLAVISGGAGASAGNPRVFGLANIYRSPKSPYRVNGGVQIVVSKAGLYRVQQTIPYKGWWAYFVTINHLRGGSAINSMTTGMARGTWGNPPGVTGFDQGHVGNLYTDVLFVMQVGDSITFSSYTTGGGDASSLGGGNGSLVMVSRVSATTAVEDASTVPAAVGVDPLSVEPPSFHIRPEIFIKRPGFPESYPGGVDDPDYRETE